MRSDLFGSSQRVLAPITHTITMVTFDGLFTINQKIPEISVAN